MCFENTGRVSGAAYGGLLKCILYVSNIDTRTHLYIYTMISWKPMLKIEGKVKRKNKMLLPYFSSSYKKKKNLLILKMFTYSIVSRMVCIYIIYIYVM